MPSPETTIAYTKLNCTGPEPRIAALAAKKGEVWLAPDHFIYTERSGYSEKARRFFFADIQAISITPTNSAYQNARVLTAISVIVLLLAIALIALHLQEGSNSLALPFFYILAVVISVPCIWGAVRRWLMVPSCHFAVHTAAQSHTLATVASMKRARILEETLRQRILETQGTVPATELDGSWNAERQVGSAAATSERHIRLSADVAAAPPKLPFKPGWHATLFALQIIGSAHSAYALANPELVIESLSTLLLVVQAVAFIGVLINQSRRRSTGELRLFTWLILLSTGFFFFAQFYSGIFLASWRQETTVPFTELAGMPYFQGIMVADIVVSTVLGALGLFALRRAMKQPAATPPPLQPAPTSPDEAGQ